MRLLFVGDVVGRPGRRAVSRLLPELRRKYAIDLCVVNGENAAGGRGINEQCSRDLFQAGADYITLGNHAFDNKEVYQLIERDQRLIRPLNLPPGNPGFGHVSCPHKEGLVVVALLCGRVFMPPFDCPFRAVDELIERHEGATKARFIIDFHAEATSEKLAFARYVDGRVAAAIGTHTHVPTADEQILPGGTAYVTDVGMTGPYDSVIGMRVESSLKRFMQLHPVRFDVARGDVRLAAVFVEIDWETGVSTSIERLLLPVPLDQSSDEAEAADSHDTHWSQE
jgi:hypothetical protein